MERRRILQGCDLALLAIGFGVVAALIVLVAIRLDDRFLLNHVSGAWMSLAKAASEGMLFPPLLDGEHYGGTRFMPLPILAHAGLAEITGEYVASGKLLNAVCAGLLGAVVFTALGASGVGLPARLALASVVWLTYPGLQAVASIRNDAMPVALQLAAILLIERRAEWSRPEAAAAAAGVLCALAIFWKFSAVWAPAAIGVYLLVHDRRNLKTFAAAAVGASVLGIMFFQALSDGRMAENLLALGGQTDRTLHGVLGDIRRLLRDFEAKALMAWVFVPVALLAVACALQACEIRLRHLALGASGLVTIFVYTDAGVYPNHLIDLCVLTPLIAAEVWAGAGPRTSAILTGLFIWIAATVTATDTSAPKEAARAALGYEYVQDPLAAWVEPGHKLLSEDSYFPVLYGQRPVVQDAYMFKRMWEAAPEIAAALVARIQGQEFDSIILKRSIHRMSAHRMDAEERAAISHFGLPVWDAISENYTMIGRAAGFYVYAPNP